MTYARRFLRYALDKSMYDDGMKEGPEPMPPSDPSQDGIMKTPPITFDFKVPFVYMASGAIFVIGGLIGMYYQLANVSQSVSEMKQEMRALTAIAQEVALMRYRIEKLEAQEKASR